MGLLNLFRRRPNQHPTKWVAHRDRARQPEPHMDGGVWSLRRWDVAKTHRLNKAHWQCAVGNSVNDDLASYLETLRTRCDYEAANNPLVEGVITTHQTDLVGRSGPRLQVQSDNERYNDLIESAWQEFFAMPDVNGIIGGPEAIGLWLRQLWLRGSFINVLRETDRDGPFSLALRLVDARRLDTPPDRAGDPNVAFGVRLTQEGKPIEYYMRKPQRSGPHDIGVTYEPPIPADAVQHRFLSLEPDQVTGVPWLATCLQVISDLRDYDSEVLEAARQAANQALYWWTTHPDATYYEVNETTEIERGTQQTGPPGWQPSMLNPTQPSTSYKEFRHERLRELGRPVNMPLMMVLLSSAESNFASAHYDGAIYIRGIQKLQSWIDRLTLSPLVDLIAAEVRIATNTAEPADVTYDWTWDVPPYVNPKQQYDAIRAQLEDGVISYPDALAAYGRDMETTIAKRVRANELLEDAGLPPVTTGKSSNLAPPDEQQDEDGTEQPKEEPENADASA